MIPNSVAAVVSFLLLLAPGIVWQVQRARYRPAVKETALVEVSRVILVSLFSTAGAAALLMAWVWLPLYRSAIEDGSGALNSPASAVPYIGAVVATSMLACALTYAVAAFKWTGKPPISEGRVWSQAFVDWRPPAAGPPYLTVELLDGTVWRGQLLGFDSDPEDDQRSLAVGRPLRRKRPGDEDFEEKDDEWRAVILPESQIKSIQVVYPRRA
ncbi:DUF6338 family protein [Georgenia thermotolerans]|uniref:Uncharacterized protein n=1 Tax=Georgenia thermotolerans TaxID=527326 RepID=A0A7J5USC2_9MICO|nr:DUF6338 family protein [Georgenia thermotolerans]KAE8765352.1 hypothetical protein GB883_04105 [Georgenia thermotolerans]